MAAVSNPRLSAAFFLESENKTSASPIKAHAFHISPNGQEHVSRVNHVNLATIERESGIYPELPCSGLIEKGKRKREKDTEIGKSEA